MKRIRGFELSKVKKLVRHSTFKVPKGYHYFRILTLYEANTRLQEYHPYLKLLIYRGAGREALVKCSICGSTFNTLGKIGNYFYYPEKVSYCFACKTIAYLKDSRKILKDKNLKIHSVNFDGKNKLLNYTCNICNKTQLDKRKDLETRGCKHCYNENVKKELSEFYRKNNIILLDLSEDFRYAKIGHIKCKHGEIVDRAFYKASDGCSICARKLKRERDF